MQIMLDAKETWYFVFSKSEFTNELEESSKSDPNIKLITLDDMRPRVEKQGVQEEELSD